MWTHVHNPRIGKRKSLTVKTNAKHHLKESGDFRWPKRTQDGNEPVGKSDWGHARRRKGSKGARGEGEILKTPSMWDQGGPRQRKTERGRPERHHRLRRVRRKF